MIEGIEVSRIFGCGEMYGHPQCDRAQVDAGLSEVHKLGVRTFFPIHEFDNAFGGTKGIASEQGVLVNAGNKDETGSFWAMRPCPAKDQDAQQMTTEPTGALAAILNGPAAPLLGGSPAPVYGPGPQCNTRGLTALGAYLIRQMAKRHFIIQLDHMDSKTATAAMGITERVHYAEVVSAHCCGSYQLNPRIYRVGGFVSPQKDQPGAFGSVYQTDKGERSLAYDFGLGYGSDMNGLSDQPGPLTGQSLHYPFKSYDGRVTFDRELWGTRTFDLNKDGLANYGMYADWLQTLREAGDPTLAPDMINGGRGLPGDVEAGVWRSGTGLPSFLGHVHRARRGSDAPGRLVPSTAMTR